MKKALSRFEVFQIFIKLHVVVCLLLHAWCESDRKVQTYIWVEVEALRECSLASCTQSRPTCWRQGGQPARQPNQLNKQTEKPNQLDK